MIAAVLLWCAASLTPTTLAAEGGVAAFQSRPGGCISLADCGEMGPLHINGAVGSASRTVIDSTRKLQALRFSYTLAPGSIGGIWTRAYPADVNADTVDTLAVSAVAGSDEQAKDVNVTVELKGTRGQQVLHLGVGTTLALNRQILAWEAIGEFREMVLLVHHAAGAGTVAGHVDFCAEFGALPVTTKLAMAGAGRLKVLGILVVIAATLAGLWGAVSKPAQPEHGRSSGIRADLFIGFNAVLVIAMAILTYSIGDIPAIELGGTCFVVIILGGIVSAVMRRGLTGQALTVGEALRDTLFPGLLAVSATSTPIWSAPQTWSDLGEVSSLGAATFISLYHVVNAYCLNVRRRHLSFFGGMLLIAVPYAFGLLLALQNLALFDTIVTVKEGWQTTLLHSAGAVVLIFVFVEFAAQAFSLVTRQYFMHDWVAQKHILRMSAAVVVAPFIADLGSGEWAASLPWLVRPLLAVATTVLSQGALWAITFAVTGMVLDAFRNEEPNQWRILANARKGMVNGMVYSGVLMAILQILSLILRFELAQSLFLNCRLPAMALGGALVFPLLKTIIETFDGSVAFFARTRQSYHKPLLYVRGLVVGPAASMALDMHFVDLPTDQRALFGLLVGIGALAGVTLLHDVVSPAWGGEGRQSWRVYFCQSLLGGFVGAAMGFYLDASQVPVIIERFTDYTSFGHAAKPDDCYPLLSKWGRITVGSYTGGARLLFNQALKGVIGWGVAAWLFALNKSLLNAVFERDFSHIRRLASREGLAELGQGSIRVLRWGLWMAPVIFTFLRQAETPTWYNQDGAIRTAACIYNSMAMSPQGFQDWSLQLFTRMLGYDYLRILIWLDHMGLRVATLVNISFIGLERLDGKITRFAGPVDGGPGFIPEAVKRFTTWAPLLLPFYIPKGPHWDYAWDTSQQMQAAQSGWIATLLRQPPETLAAASVATFVGVVLSLSVARFWRERGTRVPAGASRLTNAQYTLIQKSNGEINSFLQWDNIDLTRRVEKDNPCGRALFIVDATDSKHPKSWPVAGNFPQEFAASRTEYDGKHIRLTNESNDIRTLIDAHLPVAADPVELWEVTVENLSSSAKQVKIVPFLRWQLDRPNLRYPCGQTGVKYHCGTNAVLAMHQTTGKVGILASEIAPEGFLESRSAFIGNGDIWHPEALETLAFHEPYDRETSTAEDACGTLSVGIDLPAGGSVSLRLMMGCGHYEAEAINFIKSYLRPRIDEVRLHGPHTRMARP